MRYGPIRLTSTTRRHTAGSSSQVVPLPPVMPALLTRMSTRPSAASVAAVAAPTAASSVSSTVTPRAEPFDCNEPVAASSRAASMSQSTTRAPLAMKRSAIA